MKRFEFVFVASLLLALGPGRVIAAQADGVVASQGDVSLTLADIDAYAAKIPQSQRGKVFSSPQRVESLIRNMLARKELLKEAQALKLQEQPAVKDAMQRAADDALISARVEALRKQVTASVPDMTEMARERYMADPAAYAVPRQVDVRHILVSTKTRSDAEAKQLAGQLYKELLKDPSAFEADVEKYSDDESKVNNGGLMTNASSKGYVEPFRAAASALDKVGDISVPVKTQYGYHILKLVRDVPAHSLGFDDVKDKLVKKLRDDYIARKVQDHLDGVRSAELVPDMDLVKSLTTRYAVESGGESAD